MPPTTITSPQMKGKNGKHKSSLQLGCATVFIFVCAALDFFSLLSNNIRCARSAKQIQIDVVANEKTRVHLLKPMFRAAINAVELK